jgi:outer membrane protein TolC
MRLQQPVYLARLVTTAVALVFISATTSLAAFGQTGQLRLTGALQPAAADTPAQQSLDTVRRLSIDEAARLALEQNLGIRIQRMDPQIQDVGIVLARSAWAPSLTSSLSKTSQTQQATSALSGGATSIDNGTFAATVGISQTTPWGGSYTANWNSSRASTTNLFSSFSPQLNSTLNLSVTQPLLRNYSIDQIRQQVATSRKARDLSDIQLQSVVTQTIRSVKNAYWDLSYAINNLKAQQESLALSQQSLTDNQKRVEIGTMAPIDIVQAQAEVASNEERVIVAEAAITQAQDVLRSLILDPATPDFWLVAFDPTDAASFNEQAIDMDAAVKNAIDRRSDLRQAKNSLEQSDINIRYFKNQILPDVNAQFNYATTAAGGVQLSPVNLASIGASTNRTVIADRGFGSVLGDVFQSTYPNWTLGVQIGYPLGTNAAHANLTRARLQFEQSQSQLKNLELQVATQVRAAARNVQTNQKRVQSVRASRELQEKKLDAEQKKLAAGMSSSFFVFQAQRDLALARTAEIQAISDYNKSLVDFEAVQEVPLNGGSAPITVAGR